MDEYGDIREFIEDELEPELIRLKKQYELAMRPEALWRRLARVAATKLSEKFPNSVERAWWITVEPESDGSHGKDKGLHIVIEELKIPFLARTKLRFGLLFGQTSAGAAASVPVLQWKTSKGWAAQAAVGVGVTADFARARRFEAKPVVMASLSLRMG